MTSRKISRRKILELAVAAPALAAMPEVFRGQKTGSDFGQSLLSAKSAVVPVVEGTNVDSLKLIRRWVGPICKSSLVNNGRQSVKIK